MKEENIGIRCLRADAGCLLTDGVIFTDEIYLSKNENAERWYQVKDEGQLERQDQIDEKEHTNDIETLKKDVTSLAEKQLFLEECLMELGNEVYA